MAHERYTSELTSQELERIVSTALESYIYHQEMNRTSLENIVYQLDRLANWTEELTEVLRDAGRGR